jgi:hypothetical protein
MSCAHGERTGLDRSDMGHAVSYRACPFRALSQNTGPPAAMAVGSRTSGLAVRAPLAAHAGAGGRGRSHKALEWLDAGRETACVITRLRLDAALY